MAKMVQFNTVEDVVSAYENAAIPAFAIFHDRQLLFKSTDPDLGAGSAFLETVCERLKEAGGYGVYTLCVYEDLPKNTKIKNNTPYDASFNFQLNKNTEIGRIAGVGPSAGMYTKEQLDLAVENALLKKKLEELTAVEDMEPTNEGEIMGAIGKVLEIPGVPEMIGAIAGRFSEFVSNMGRKNPDGGEAPVRRIMGIENLKDYERIEVAVTDLQQVLPDLADLLEKLVRMQKKNPFQFKMFLSGLRAMNY